jgi:hypothetical protein
LEIGKKQGPERERFRARRFAIVIACEVLSVALWPGLARAQGAEPATEKSAATGAEHKAPAAGAEHKAPAPADSAAGTTSSDSVAKLVPEALTFLNETKWALILVAVLFAFRKELRRLLEALGSRFESSDIDIHLEGKNLGIKLEGPAAERPGTVTVSLLKSALSLEIDGESERATDFDRIVEPDEFLVSQEATKAWADSPAAQATIADLKIKRAELEKQANGSNAPALEAALYDYIRHLEQSRFLDASALLTIMGSSPRVSTLIAAQCKQPGGRVLACAMGIAYAVKRDWQKGLDAVRPLIEPKIEHRSAFATYLCCNANLFMKNVAEQGSLQSSRAAVQAFLEHAWQTYEQQFKPGEPNGFGTKDPELESFYAREFDCFFGSVLSTLAEFGLVAGRSAWLDRADSFLLRCTTEPSALARDFNNYADLMRQREKYEEAVGYMEKARAAMPDWDPDYAETQALILERLGRRLESLLAIRAYSSNSAFLRGDVYLASYIKNQLTYAKLVFRYMRKAPTGIADRTVDVNDMGTVVAILEDAADTLALGKDSLTKEDFARLDVLIAEARGEAYLQTLWGVDEAADCFAKLTLCKYDEPEESPWRRTIALARGRIRLARLEWQNLNQGRAKRQRRLAVTLLENCETMPAPVPLARGDEGKRRTRAFLCLDLLEANLDLADAWLMEENSDAAGELAQGTIASLLQKLGLVSDDTQTALALDTADKVRLEKGLHTADRRWRYLQGRVAAAIAPIDAAVVTRVQKHFVAARTGEPAWTEKVDLALGQFLQQAALSGEGEIVAWHELALRTFETVMQSADKERRREAARAYGDAVQRYNGVLERSRKLAQRA